MGPIRAVLFDLDETLIDGRGLRDAIAATCDVLANAIPGLPSDRILAANTSVWREYAPTILPGWELGMIDDATVRRESWRRTLAECGTDNESLLELAFDSFARLAREKQRLFDDAAAMLGALKVRYLLGLITNGARSAQLEKLEATGIESFFDVVVTSGSIGIAKPDGGIFDYALQRLGLAANEAVHVGDSLQTDVAGARAAGVYAVWLNRNGRVRSDQEPAPDAEIASLAELKALLGPRS